MKPYLASPMAEPHIYEQVLSFIPKHSKHKKILDIAAGQGYISERLSHKGFSNLHCADINSKNFKLNKKQFHFQTVDANSVLPYTNNQFDVIISSETIEHLQNPRLFLSELHRILKPKGSLILTTPNVTNVFSRFYFFFTSRLAFHTPNDYKLTRHIAILPNWLLKYFFAETGLKVQSITYSSCYIPIIKIRLTNKFFLRYILGWITIYKLQKH
jgi:2-polyprenyl-3-methyl-5-hydroxy-6-metoxy-1,4-benzoquinol methylase